MKTFSDLFLFYKDYNESLIKYNEWFIKIRNFASIGLIIYLLFINYILKYELNPIQLKIFGLVAIFIFTYNIIFRNVFYKNENNEDTNYFIWFSFIQIALDLLCLSVLIYFMGGIESPIIYLFMFHMVIGSLLFPAKLIYLIAAFIVTSLTTFTFLEYFQVISHQNFSYNTQSLDYLNLSYIFNKLSIFALIIFTSIYLTSKIIDELYARERQLKNALLQLKDAEINKQKYIIAVVHELKSPLAASISQVDIINDGYVGNINAEVKDKLNRVKTRLTNAIDNINNILHISKFKLLNKLEIEKLSIVDLLNEAIESVQSTLDKKNIKLEILNKLERNEIKGDKVLLNLAFSNLISNSVKYNKDNGNIIIALLHYYDGISIKIIDDGIGIPSKDRSRIFSDYYRASNAIDNKIEGTGTGLSIVKQIIDNHAGMIDFVSPSTIKKENRPGTEFNIYLPDNID